MSIVTFHEVIVIRRIIGKDNRTLIKTFSSVDEMVKSSISSKLGLEPASERLESIRELRDLLDRIERRTLEIQTGKASV